MSSSAQQLVAQISRDNYARYVMSRIETRMLLLGFDARSCRSLSREGRVMRLRRFAYWLTAELTGHNWSSVGRAFGRDHTTILKVARSFQRRLNRGDEWARALLERFLADEMTEDAI